MEIREIDKTSNHVFMNLAIAYEAEFSKITNKKPNSDGTFNLDVELGGDVKGFILFVESLPAGFAIISYQNDNNYEVCEFFIIPYYRRQNIGKKFINSIFDMYPGAWQVKQIEGADYAVSFWRSVISDYTKNSYSEVQCSDDYWGKVTKQIFNNS